jgi:signal transduction histidine kinase
VTTKRARQERGDADALEALNAAALTIAAEHSLDKVLQTIVDLARELAGARYGAIGVPGPDGQLAQFVVSGMSDEEVARIEHKPEGLGLLGLLLESPQTIRLPDVASHPHSVGFPPNHPNMTSFLGVSMTARGNLLGNLYLTDKVGTDEFSERDEWLIHALAAHAAVAIENAHLYEQTRQVAILEERERIGMDLHDGVIQSIYAVGLSLELSKLVLDENPYEARSHITAAIQGLDATIRDIRSYIMDLQPGRIQDEALTEALARLVREFRANTLVQISLEVASDIDDGLADNTRLALFHITQEALANIAKHARASTVTVRLTRLHDRVVLIVEDDGAGFDAEKIGGIPGHGLSNMAIRARALGGDLTMASSPGDGTRVRAVIPARPMSNVLQPLVSFP